MVYILVLVYQVEDDEMPALEYIWESEAVPHIQV